jgi:integrase
VTGCGRDAPGSGTTTTPPSGGRATQLLLAGVHPKVAQERLGHSTVSVTLDLYSHVTATMQEDAAAKIDAAFRGGKMASEAVS